MPQCAGWIGRAHKVFLEQLEHTEGIEKSEELEKQAELARRKEEIQEKGHTIRFRQGTNRNILESIRKKSADLAALEEEYGWLSSLSDTVNGELKSKEKIMLETYVQTAYFDRIVRRANLRLMVMSGGQYEFKRLKGASNNKSQGGLELNVVDHYNGTERSVKTLSGGESFIAALSLAMGLSEEIQSSAGGYGWIPCSWTRALAAWMKMPCSRLTRRWQARRRAAVSLESSPMWGN